MGKQSLLIKAISKAQLLKYKVISFIEPQPERLTLQNIIDSIATNLSLTSRKKLSVQHGKLVANINKYEDSRDLDSLGVLYSNIIEYIYTLSKDQPVLITISNIERRGLDSLKFLTHLINEIEYLNADVKVILSHATDYPHSDALDTQLASLANNAYSLPIRGFNNAELKTLSTALFESDIFSKKEYSDILLLTDGIPLYIIDYYNFLILNDIISKTGRAYFVNHKKLSTYQSAEIFDDLADQIVAGLSTDELYVLQLLSAHNNPIETNILNTFMSFDIAPVIDSLERADLIESKNNLSRLLSPIIKNYLIRNTQDDQSTSIHRDLAYYSIQVDPENFPMIANHFIQARDIEQSYSYTIKAHDEHMAQHEYYSAFNLLLSLKSLIDTQDLPEIRSTVLSKLAPLELTLGYVDDSIENYTYLLNMAPNEESKAEYYNRLGYIEQYYKGNSKKAVNFYNRALDIARNNSNAIIESEALISLGIVLNDVSFLESAATTAKDILPAQYIRAISNAMYYYTFSGDAEKYNAIDIELDDLLDESDLRTTDRIYFSKYVKAFYTGEYDTAHTVLGKMIALDKLSCDEISRIDHMSGLAGLNYIQGKFNDQIGILDKACHLAKIYQAYSHLIVFLANKALGHISIANFSEAIALIFEGSQYIAKYNVSAISPTFPSTGARAFLLMGSLYHDKYKEFTETSKESIHKYNNKIGLGHLELRHADSAYYNLELKTAINHALISSDIFKGANAKDDLLEALLKLSLTHRHMGDHEIARDYARQAAKIFREINCGYLKPLYSYVIALSEVHDNSKSLAPMLEAIDVSREFGTREWTWQIQFELARLYKQAGDISNSVKYSRESINTLKEITEAFDNSEQISSYLQVPLRTQVFDFVKSLKS